MSPQIESTLDRSTLRRFCQKWRVTRLALFGSGATGGFNSTSDIDLLISFEEGVEWSLLDHVAMRSELSQAFGREVDLVTKDGLERTGNAARRKAILDSAEVLDVS